jgi:hypothetical protein
MITAMILFCRICIEVTFLIFAKFTSRLLLVHYIHKKSDLAHECFCSLSFLRRCSRYNSPKFGRNHQWFHSRQRIFNAIQTFYGYANKSNLLHHNSSSSNMFESSGPSEAYFYLRLCQYLAFDDM